MPTLMITLEDFLAGGEPSPLTCAIADVRERYAFPWARQSGRKHSVIELNGAS